LGKTKYLTVERRSFYDYKELAREVIEVASKIEELDYISYVPDGEPTLDINLGREIEIIKREINCRIAVLTNSSLLHYDDVREDLYLADLVSIKIDAVSEDVFRRLNRPHSKLKISSIKEGIVMFTEHFNGDIITETMLVKGLNDNSKEIIGIAKFISSLKNIRRAYISIPIRPPTEHWVKIPRSEDIVMAYDLFMNELGGNRVETLTSYEGENFTLLTDDIVNEILSIVNVNPLREDYARKIIERKGLNPNEVINKMLMKNIISIVKYRGHRFLIRKIS